jgi:hypothetical protein
VGIAIDRRRLRIKRFFSLSVTCVQLSLYRKAGPSGRARLAVELSDAVRETTLAGIRRRHPEYSEREVALPSNSLKVQRRVARIRLQHLVVVALNRPNFRRKTFERLPELR